MMYWRNIHRNIQGVIENMNNRNSMRIKVRILLNRSNFSSLLFNVIFVKISQSDKDGKRYRMGNEHYLLCQWPLKISKNENNTQKLLCNFQNFEHPLPFNYQEPTLYKLAAEHWMCQGIQTSQSNHNEQLKFKSTNLRPNNQSCCTVLLWYDGT